MLTLKLVTYLMSEKNVYLQSSIFNLQSSIFNYLLLLLAPSKDEVKVKLKEKKRESLLDLCTVQKGYIFTSLSLSPMSYSCDYFCGNQVRLHF